MLKCRVVEVPVREVVERYSSNAWPVAAWFVLAACSANPGSPRPVPLTLPSSGAGGTSPVVAPHYLAGGSPPECAGRECVFQATPSAPATPPPPPSEPDLGLCETIPAPATRPICPSAAPVVGDCSLEGVGCLYDSGKTGCFEGWLCRQGLWSPTGTACEAAPSQDPLTHPNDARCPRGQPVDDSPCDVDGLDCGYQTCWNGDPAITVTCTCARWKGDYKGCIVL